MLKTKRLFSGMRPTGRLHLGNWLGALENWVKLQDEYESLFCIVDWHALTTGYQDTSELQENIRQMAIDWLSAGLDPEKSIIFVQSHVKEHAELYLLLSMVTPLSWVERVPTYKEQLQQLEGREIATYGFLGYPVLQTADIAAYKAEVVPVGEDQLPHLELAREIVRRFNYLFGPIFPEPQARLNKVTMLVGIDNRKMSKSYGNTIELSLGKEEIKEKVRAMITDPARIKKSDPGHPEVCTVFAYHKIFNAVGVSELEVECRAGGIGCVACKNRLGEILATQLEPMHERRLELEAKPQMVTKILAEGAEQARNIARQTLAEVREAIGI